MAHVNIPERNQQLRDAGEIAAFLSPFGISFEQWSTEATLPENPTNEQILAGYSKQIDALKRKGGYVTADVINVTPDVPNLQAMLDRFNKEHTHAEDEVRFIVKGRGVFHIHPKDGPVFSIELTPGDLINVPAGTQHWFDLCSDRTIRAIRLFKEMAGWVPAYIENGVHDEYEPLCFGPAYIAADLPAVAGLRLQRSAR
jgi:1,2-dihydroxy-3-keto-5-methylthiopentene dioxygenase